MVEWDCEYSDGSGDSPATPGWDVGDGEGVFSPMLDGAWEYDPELVVEAAAEWLCEPPDSPAPVRVGFGP